MNVLVNETVLAALLGALVTGIGGLLVPMLIARVPEPAAKPSPEPDPEPPKMLYADMAARPGLGWRTALIAAGSGAVLGAATGLDWPLLWLLPLTPVAVALSVIPFGPFMVIGALVGLVWGTALAGRIWG